MDIDVNGLLAKIGADGPGDLKVYAGNSRLKIFVKAKKLPTEPTIEVTSDLPGDYEEMIATAINKGIELLRSLKTKLNEGNETPALSPG